MKAGGRRLSAPFAPSGAYQSGNETSSHSLSERRDRDATRMTTAAKTRHELNIRQRRGKTPPVCSGVAQVRGKMNTREMISLKLRRCLQGHPQVLLNK